MKDWKKLERLKSSFKYVGLKLVLLIQLMKFIDEVFFIKTLHLAVVRNITAVIIL